MLEVVAQLGHRRVALGWITPQGAIDYRFELRRDVGSHSPQPRRVSPNTTAHHREGVVALIRDLASEHFVQHDADGVNVGSSIASRAANLLRRHVVWRTHAVREGAKGQPARTDEQRNTKVDKFDLALRRDQDILWLEVAVDDATLMTVLQRVGKLVGDAQ